MKQYGILIVMVILVLMLLPLPAFFSKTTSDNPSTSQTSSQTTNTQNRPESSDTESSVSTTTSPTATDEKDSFKVLDTKTGNVIEINERDFIISTVACEMYPSYHTEALKAQAVAAYTYYSVQRNKNQSKLNPALKGADFSDVPNGFPEYYSVEGLKKRWGTQFDTYYNKIKNAVDAVFGKKIYYKDEAIVAAYHSIGLGETENAKVVWGSEYAYLKSVPSPGDKLSPNYQSTAVFKETDFKNKILTLDKSVKFSNDPSSWISGTPKASEAGTVTAITVGDKTFTGAQIRTAFGLRSACFTVRYSNKSFEFTVHGYGHGVGMSQYGADYLARQGSDWQEILHYYYTDIEIK